MSQWHLVRWVGVAACLLSWVAFAIGNDALWIWSAAVALAVCAYGVAIMARRGRRV